MSNNNAETTNRIREYLADIRTNIEEILSGSQAIIYGSHLVLTSGNHSDGYINVRKLAGRSDALDEIGYYMYCLINMIKDEELPYAEMAIIGPETMGRSLAQAASAKFFEHEDCVVPHFWCEPNADKTAMVWNSKMDFDQRVPGKHCYIVDDVATTAKTLTQTIKLIEDSGGIVAGVIVVVRRNLSITADSVGVPWLIPLYDIELKTYDPEKAPCPLCEARVPMLLHPGHGHEWIETHPDYPTVP